MRAVVDGIALPIESADHYSLRPGLEAISFVLPRNLAGRRSVDVMIVGGTERRRSIDGLKNAG